MQSTNIISEVLAQLPVAKFAAGHNYTKLIKLHWC